MKYIIKKGIWSSFLKKIAVDAASEKKSTVIKKILKKDPNLQQLYTNLEKRQKELKDYMEKHDISAL